MAGTKRVYPGFSVLSSAAHEPILTTQMRKKATFETRFSELHYSTLRCDLNGSHWPSLLQMSTALPLLDHSKSAAMGFVRMNLASQERVALWQADSVPKVRGAALTVTVRDAIPSLIFPAIARRRQGDNPQHECACKPPFLFTCRDHIAERETISRPHQVILRSTLQLKPTQLFRIRFLPKLYETGIWTSDSEQAIISCCHP